MMLERLKQLPPNISCLPVDSANGSRNSKGSKVTSKKVIVNPRLFRKAFSEGFFVRLF